MTDLDVIYTQKAVGILSVMKNIATEYIENVYNSTSHSTLSISWKHVESINCNNDHVCWAYKKNILVKSITTVVNQIKHNLLRRQQIGCVTKHKKLVGWFGTYVENWIYVCKDKVLWIITVIGNIFKIIKNRIRYRVFNMKTRWWWLW